MWSPQRGCVPPKVSGVLKGPPSQVPAAAPSLAHQAGCREPPSSHLGRRHPHGREWGFWGGGNSPGVPDSPFPGACPKRHSHVTFLGRVEQVSQGSFLSQPLRKAKGSIKKTPASQRASTLVFTVFP